MHSSERALLLLCLSYCPLAMRDLTLPRFFCVAAVDVISIAPAVFLLCSSRCQQKVSLIRNRNRQSGLRLMELRRRTLTCELVQ